MNNFSFYNKISSFLKTDDTQKVSGRSALEIFGLINLIVLLLLLSTNDFTWAASPTYQETDGESYTVQANDWLSKIAEKHYDDIFAYTVIVEATNAKAAEDDSFAFIEDPNVIEVGQLLWIPAIADSEVEQTEQAEQPGEAMAQDEYNDAFAYCAAIGTIDAPDERYTGPQTPDEIVQGVMAAAGISEDAPLETISAGTNWRCMDSQVWACNVGANLPCGSKADTSDVPTEGMFAFCQENLNSDFIPAYATGRQTIYQWHCVNDTPEVIKQVFEVDAQGYQVDFWYEIPQE